VTFWFWGTGREGLSIDGSRFNRIANNRFSGNAYGAIFLYKNCGEYVNSRPERWWHRRYGADGNLIEDNTITGGTNGILVDALRRFRPFTPGFVGRAEDQAYLLSTLDEPGGLAGLHASGLFMRHDKEGFAREAIGKARVGSRVGDLLRILVFSAYAGALDMGVEGVKERVDPFTGSFITRLPVTAALTRFALQAAVSFGRGRIPEALEFVQSGARQLEEALGFTASGAFERTLHDERRGWDLFYRCLSAAEAGLGSGEAWAAAAREEARAVVSDCRLALGRGPRGTLS
jgi:parallel beta-helix repeat protein